MSPLLEQGFKGEICPVNPKYDEILGLKAYARVRDIPGPVDFVISSVPAAAVPALLDDCAEKGVKLVHLFTARFSETGRKEAARLEQDILRRARAAGIRLIGPNCMCVYYPDEGISFNEGMPRDSGPVGVVSQSGQAVGEMVQNAAVRGVRFSKAISYGNALDFNECDYLEYFLQDEQTQIVLLYIEGVRDGPRFLRVLRELAAVKPVIVVKGGRGEAGKRATASHTGSLSGAREIWDTVVKQTGVVTACDLEELVDIVVAFYFMKLPRGRRLGVIGGSGGTSVLAADLCEEAGLEVIPLPEDIRVELKKRENPVWDWISNPADFSITDRADSGTDISRLMIEHPDFDIIMMFVSGPWHRGQRFSTREHLKRSGVPLLRGRPSVVVFGDRARGTGREALRYERINNQLKEKLIEMSFPVFPNIRRAANAVSRMLSYYEGRR